MFAVSPSACLLTPMVCLWLEAENVIPPWHIQSIKPRHHRHFLKLIVSSEHLRLLHGGPTLVFSALAQRFHISVIRKTVTPDF